MTTESKIESLHELVRAKIENLRPKLLDLSRRNPLISTKLGPRSNSHIRAVDELPDVLFFKLNNGQEMDIVPLPPIEADPRDEQSDVFRETMINARLTDDSYIAEMEAIDRDADDYLDQARTIERGLKDRVRALLGLAPRVQKSEINLTQHAKNNGISPGYELPSAADEHKDGRHTDDKIQTLLLPEDLERKLNAITSKSRTWVQETGMNVLQFAFGFLEWIDANRTESSFAPLILLQIELRRERTSQGPKYSISGTGDEPELNAVLAEKLHIDFAIEIPPFDGSSIEVYLQAVLDSLPRKTGWRVRRQVALGVFPSARMAMYHDLDPQQPHFPDSEIVNSLLGGSDATGASPFADEYNVDEPEIERKVPFLVMDADSSQFSALADISDGKNLAIEGPPGTGKSQTIVNAIAGALAQKKKILFVAEKLAALNVVKSRLEAVGLGEFLLPLQAEKSTREQIIESIKSRLEMRDVRPVREYEEKLGELQRVRNQLAEYIELIKREFGDSRLPIHTILGKSIATNQQLSQFSSDVLDRCKLQPEMQTAAGFSMLLQLGQQIEVSHAATLVAKPAWRETRLVSPDRFTVEEACSLSKKSAEHSLALAEARDAFEPWGLDHECDLQTLEKLRDSLSSCIVHLRQHSQGFLRNILTDGRSSALASFFAECNSVVSLELSLKHEISTNLEVNTLESLNTIAAICSRASLTTTDISELREQLESKKASESTVRAVSAALAPLISACRDAQNWQLDDIAKARALYRDASREALAYKTPELLHDNAAYHLRTLCEEGLALQSDRLNLSNVVDISVELTLDNLVDCASTFRNAGPLAFLSGSYRQANRLFRSISRLDKYSKADAIRCLDNMISLRRRSHEFGQRAATSRLFGRYYRGLDTRFEPFLRIARFIEGIHESFDTSEHATLRSFLLNASISELDLLPAVRATGISINYASLQTRIETIADEAAKIEIAISDLTQVGRVLTKSDVGHTEIQDIKDRLAAFLAQRDNVDYHPMARELLGAKFAGYRTPPDNYSSAISWALSAGELAPRLQAILLRDDPSQAHRTIDSALNAASKLADSLTRLSDVAQIDIATFTRGLTLRQSAEKLNAASSDSDGLFAFATFANMLQEAAPHGIMPLAEARLRENSMVAFGAQVEALAIRDLAKAVFTKFGNKLTKYRGTRLNELRAKLAQQDREIIQLSQRHLRARIKAAARPPAGNGLGRKSTWTDMALIENEISKKQRFIPVRDLTQRAGRALAELKPCWMMSPLAVAQYLPKGSVHFDLCIIDEASQMPPESAIGALLRCSQAIVVGDTNQLPPSNFFKTVIEDDEEDEDEAVLSESVLEMANGSFRPARRLRWHYRSRHSGLIKFSNRLVYDDNLIVFPSATETLTRMGVEFRATNGRYKAGTNPIEAKAMIEAAIEFMRTDPDRSLGLVTLNQKQRDLILEEFEHAASRDRAIQQYVDRWKEKNDGLEEFFIKNLENVQGDERDVIFIGTVYGAEAPNTRVMQRFGPINGLAGRRRLNVLFTRAKQKIVTFSSMTAADIEAEENGNQGAYMLKRWLEYSASGVLDSGDITEREPDSDFEIFVANQIKAMGCIPVPQVGVAGYFVDIGVRHPDWPHGFILGVECDGATYHSAKSARDRDRLRQEVLENLGWTLHRIWSTDWFNSPGKETELLREVIGKRLAALKAREHEYVQRPAAASAAKAVEIDQRPIAVEPPDSSHKTGPEQSISTTNDSQRVEIGDTVRLRYLTDDKRTIKVTISKAQSDLAQGIIHYRTPVASALLGTEEGDEIEVLVGSYIRPAIVESVSKGR